MKKQPDIFQGVQQRIKKEEEEQKINEHIVDIKANQVHTNNYKGNYAGQVYVGAFASDSNYHSYKINKKHMNQLQQFMQNRKLDTSKQLDQNISILKEATRARYKLETPGLR